MKDAKVLFTIVAALFIFCAESAKEDNNSFLLGTWEGTFTQFSLGINDTYPMVMTLDFVEGSNFSGKINYPTLDNSLSRMEGRIIADGTANNVLNQKNLTKIYGFRIIIKKHPKEGYKYILPDIESDIGVLKEFKGGGV